jgi:hypothetical protein
MTSPRNSTAHWPTLKGGRRKTANWKALQERRNLLKRVMEAMIQTMREAEKAIEGLRQDIERNRALAKQAKECSWKGVVKSSG